MTNNKLRSRERLLWGKSGEELLKNSKIIILGSSILMSELSILLAYSGIGQITLVDDQILQKNDYGTCFVSTGEMERIVNQYRINLIRDYLENLSFNIQLNIECIFESPVEYINTQLKSIYNNSIIKFNVVVCCNIPNRIIYNMFNTIKNYHLFNNPFIVNLKSKGFMGMYQIFSLESNYLTLDLSNESKNMALLEGLQLNRPIKPLLDYSSQINFDEIDNTNISKIPFPLLLIKCKFSNSNEDNCLFSKDDCIKYLKENIRSDNNKNFIEAFNHIKLIFSNAQDFLSKLQTEDSIRNFVIDNDNINIGNQYKIILEAILTFYNVYNRNPVTNELPDMYCDTISYLQLQKIYNDQFVLDSEEVYRFIVNKHKNLRNSNQINLEFVQFVCRYLYCLKSIKFKNTFTHLYSDDKRIYPTAEISKSLIDAFFEDLEIESHELSNLVTKIELDNSLLLQFLLLDFFDTIIDNNANYDQLINLKKKFKYYLSGFRLENIISIPENDVLSEM